MIVVNGSNEQSIGMNESVLLFVANSYILFNSIV